MGLTQIITQPLGTRESLPTPIGFGGLTSGTGAQAAAGIAAQGANRAIVITYLQAQVTTAATNTVLFSGTPLSVICAASVGSGIAQVFEGENRIRLAANTAFIPDVAQNNPVRISGLYHVIDTTTGLPV